MYTLKPNFQKMLKSGYLFENKGEYLYLAIEGEYERDEFLSYPKKILEECEKEKIYKVLVNCLDVQGTGYVPMMDRFFMGVEIARTLTYRVKLAVAWPERDINKFAEDVAVNRGSHMCVMGSIEDVKLWLFGNT